MHCAACPADRRWKCGLHGCHSKLAEARVATCVGTYRDVMLQSAGQDLDLRPVEEAIDRQLRRLDVESGDVLVVRTRAKLDRARSERWQEELQELCRSQGIRDVSVIVLDDCTDLTIERPRRPDTRMQHQARAIPPQPMQGQ